MSAGENQSAMRIDGGDDVLFVIDLLETVFIVGYPATTAFSTATVFCGWIWLPA